MVPHMSRDNYRDNPPKLLIKATGGVVDFDLTIESWRPAIFVGMNSTLKSVMARTIIGETPNLENISKLETLEIKILNEDREEAVSCREERGMERNADCLYIEDYRLAFRKALEFKDKISHIYEDIENLKVRVSDHEKTYIEDLFKKIQGIIDSTLYGIVWKYCDYKGKADLILYANLHQLAEKLEEEFVRSLRDAFSEKDYNEVIVENLFPLDVDVKCDIKNRSFKLYVKDSRLKIFIEESLSSSAIASVLTFKLLQLFIATPLIGGEKYKIMVIEEPEEALSPPQQVFFSSYIDRAMKISREQKIPLFVIITTHSPYIAMTPENVDIYYFYYDPNRNVFTARKRVPTRPFIYAEIFQPVIASEGSSDFEEKS
jgi:predicted ATP-dependent endonuclease of OLD family